MHQANDIALSRSLQQEASAIAAVTALCPITFRNKAINHVNLLRLSIFVYASP